MVATTLGLLLISLMVGTIDKVLHASRVSAVATETIERGYFLMDAMDTWVAETSPISHDMFSKVSAQRSAPMLLALAEGALDLCETPDIASLPPASPGIILLEPSAWPCVPQRNLEVFASALLLERRLPCRANCNGAGFYAVLKHCLAGAEVEVGERSHFQIVWLDADHDRSRCFANGTNFKVARSLIYIRDYAWRVGDGIRAAMIRHLAQEPKARWLRSSMLAHGINHWQVECLFDCFEMGGLDSGALLAAAIDLSFVANARSHSINIQAVLAPLSATRR